MSQEFLLHSVTVQGEDLVINCNMTKKYMETNNRKLKINKMHN